MVLYFSYFGYIYGYIRNNFYYVRGLLMIIILTKKYAYFYKRKGITFWARILMLKATKTQYEIIDEER